MTPLHLMFLVTAIFQHATTNSIIDGTDLVFTSIVYRNGDRTPKKEGTFAPLDNTVVDLDLVEEKVAKYGYDQLTEEGRMRSYQLGKFLRSRYDSQLSETYDPSEIYVGTFNASITMETLIYQLAGLYPSQSEVFNNTVVRQPVPEDVINDPFLALSFQSCPPFIQYLSNSLNSSCSSILAQYPDLLEELTTLTGINVTEKPLLTYVLYNAYLALQNIGYELEPETKAILPELWKAAGDAIEVIIGQPEYWPLESGVILNNFFETSSKISNGICTKKMHVYSARDFNVYAMQMVSQVKIQLSGAPAYCSAFILELRRVIKTGKFVVLPVYLPYPGEEVVYLRVRGCGGYLCDLETFKGITQGYSITEQEFDVQCQGNTTGSK